MHPIISTLAVAVATLSLAANAGAAEPHLSLPLKCVPGETCWIVNYFDHDQGSGMRDYHCGTLGYDTHDGTDFAIRDEAAMAEGVAVAAAAAGTVKAVRDGVADTGLRGSVAGRECGNGVVITHGDGWETQYCHMRQGSVAVRAGQHVAQGQSLGLVGLSGNTEFPHLHLTVRHNGRKIDPFLGSEPYGACNSGTGALWTDEARVALTYRPIAIYNAGFSGDAPEPGSIRRGERNPPAVSSPALVLWADIFGADAEDRINLRIVGPQGETVVANARTVNKRQIRRFEFAGRRKPGSAWPAGTYTGEIDVTRKTSSGDLTVRRKTAIDLH